MNQENKLLEELTKALKGIVDNPYGCPMCDNGKLRNPEKEHWDDCPYKLANECLKAGFLAASPNGKEEDAVDGWVNEKPKFKEDCVLIAATKYKNKDWDYKLYEIKKSDGEDEDGNDAWYWGIFCDDGEEWGDLADLNADKYLVLKPLP